MRYACGALLIRGSRSLKGVVTLRVLLTSALATEMCDYKLPNILSKGLREGLNNASLN